MEEGFPRLCLKNVEHNECFMWPHWTGCQKAVAGHSEKTDREPEGLGYSPSSATSELGGLGQVTSEPLASAYTATKH